MTPFAFNKFLLSTGWERPRIVAGPFSGIHERLDWSVRFGQGFQFFHPGLKISADPGLDQFRFVDPGSFLDELMDAYESDITISQWLTIHHWFS